MTERFGQSLDLGDWAAYVNDRTVRSTVRDAARQRTMGEAMDTQETDRVQGVELKSSQGPKRRQIIDGACRIFLERGFDAASMGEIARQAGVSKGTLYVYFKSKEELFEAIVEEQCNAQAEQIFTFDSNERDVEAVLTRLGEAFVHFMCRREGGISPLRTVIAIADRMPELGAKFYRAGPVVGINSLKGYLDAQIAAGVLKPHDSEAVAAQFIDSCLSLTFKPMLFNFEAAPSDAQISRVVQSAVRTLAAAYKVQD
jgi:AcrR family transcriptional regulator